jgi:PHD/YefM family antitoxin component YafN of YafNO toxin-antitoxin module
METEKILIEKIMLITNLIKEKHPELMTFLNEMPVTIPNENDPKLNLIALNDYYKSLNTLLKKYEIEHPF